MNDEFLTIDMLTAWLPQRSAQEWKKLGAPLKGRFGTVRRIPKRLKTATSIGALLFLVSAFISFSQTNVLHSIFTPVMWVCVGAGIMMTLLHTWMMRNYYSLNEIRGMTGAVTVSASRKNPNTTLLDADAIRSLPSPDAFRPTPSVIIFAMENGGVLHIGFLLPVSSNGAQLIDMTGVKEWDEALTALSRY